MWNKSIDLIVCLLTCNIGLKPIYIYTNNLLFANNNRLYLCVRRKLWSVFVRKQIGKVRRKYYFDNRNTTNRSWEDKNVVQLREPFSCFQFSDHVSYYNKTCTLDGGFSIYRVYSQCAVLPDRIEIDLSRPNVCTRVSRDSFQRYHKCWIRITFRCNYIIFRDCRIDWPNDTLCTW